VTVNKFYSINNINITNSNNNNNANNHQRKSLSRNKRGISLDNDNNFSQKSRNFLNEFQSQPQQGNSIKVNQNSLARNNLKIQEESYFKKLPIRKLDFKDESNIKFNYGNLNSSNNKNYKRNDLINFSHLRFQSCKSKMQ